MIFRTQNNMHILRRHLLTVADAADAATSNTNTAAAAGGRRSIQ